MPAQLAAHQVYFAAFAGLAAVSMMFIPYLLLFDRLRRKPYKGLLYGGAQLLSVVAMFLLPSDVSGFELRSSGQSSVSMGLELGTYQTGILVVIGIVVPWIALWFFLERDLVRTYPGTWRMLPGRASTTTVVWSLLLTLPLLGPAFAAWWISVETIVSEVIIRRPATRDWKDVGQRVRWIFFGFLLPFAIWAVHSLARE